MSNSELRKRLEELKLAKKERIEKEKLELQIKELEQENNIFTKIYRNLIGDK